MLLDQVPPVSAREQYEDYRRRRGAASSRGTFLSFTGHGDEDVYNASVPFELDGRRFIAGRVERRGSEDSRTMFFERRGEAWVLVPDAPVLEHLQDPFAARIGGELVLGGVHALWDEHGGLITYSTRFFAGRSLAGLALRAEGPERMKDVRLLELPDRRVAVFSRPQGQPMLDRFGCMAKIGFTIVESLAAVGPASVAGAPLLDGHFLPDEWGGCNQLFNLSNGLVGAIGHKSWGEKVDGVFVIHYYAMAFAVDPRTRRMTQTKVIAARDDFPPGPQKNPRAMDVVFTSGIERLGRGRALLYAGLSDCREGALEIEDPLDEYERLAP